MIFRTVVLAVLVALPLCSEPAEIMYYNFFGEYLLENSHHIDIDVPHTNLGEIKSMLEKLRQGNLPIESDLVVIGYGPAGSPREFFAATAFTDYQVPLQQVLDHIPSRQPNAQWYFYFIDPSISRYVRERRAHHWSSPFSWLAQVGLQDLHYFGPY